MRLVTAASAAIAAVILSAPAVTPVRAQLSLQPTPEGMAEDVRTSNMETAPGIIKDAPKMQPTVAITVLTAALGPGVDKSLRSSAIDISYKCAPTVTEKVLGEVMANGQTDEKTDILKKINKLAQSTQITLLQRALKDRTARVKEDAISAAAKMPDRVKVDIYREAAKIEESPIRLKVMEDTINLDRAGAYTVLDAFKSERDARVLAAMDKVRTKHKIEK
jgi:hypothetical protein